MFALPNAASHPDGPRGASARDPAACGALKSVIRHVRPS
ncbi:hypothetical protein GBP346_A0662 [Burkholderia pseudomallei MSHR346]|uniref:Uncharacterized protein n=1 Tax=Burkholderia pseudomallei 1710a TaxID=320371 RepID=A0A0E1W3C7_BURPE|nr:hypothetical protein GBP346_A0662 [Burkholderia pseudomallei MSHR346]EET06796.1 hypothetical protein BURPS1710A_1031 [Burkholderia pseudomallei 1710a]